MHWIPKVQKHVNLVDLVKSFPTNIFLQNLASIQKRTSPVKFANLAEKSGKGSISNFSTKVYWGPAMTWLGTSKFAKEPTRDPRCTMRSRCTRLALRGRWKKLIVNRRSRARSKLDVLPHPRPNRDKRRRTIVGRLRPLCMVAEFMSRRAAAG